MDPNLANQNDLIHQTNQTSSIQPSTSIQPTSQQVPSQANPSEQIQKGSKKSFFIFLSLFIIALLVMMGYIGSNYLNSHTSSAQALTKNFPFLAYLLKPSISTPGPPINNQIVHVAAPTAIPVASTTPVDCGSTSHILKLPETPAPPDKALTCFINAAKTCTPAKITMTITADINGTTTSTTYYQIQGENNGSCILDQKQGATTHIYPTSVPLAEQQAMNQALNKLVGLEENCQFVSNAKLALIFINLGEEGLTAGNNPAAGATCSGPLFTQH